jgi:hypothetical protein
MPAHYLHKSFKNRCFRGRNEGAKQGCQSAGYKIFTAIQGEKLENPRLGQKRHFLAVGSFQRSKILHIEVTDTNFPSFSFL